MSEVGNMPKLEHCLDFQSRCDLTEQVEARNMEEVFYLYYKGLIEPGDVHVASMFFDGPGDRRIVWNPK